MDVKKLMDELDRLRAIVAGWQDTAAVEKIERDMALDKLKALYEEISFGGLSALAGEAPRPEVAASSQPSSVGVRNSVSEEPVPAVPAEGTDLAEGTVAAPPATDRTGRTSVPGAPAGFEGKIVPDPVAARSGCAVSAEPAAEPPAAAAAGAGASPSQAACSVPAGAEMPVEVPESEVPFVDGTSSAAAPAFEQKLFDDDRMARIRKDKQVILSLYGDAPVAPVVPSPAPSPVAPPPVRVPVAEPAPVVRGAFEQVPSPSPVPVPGETHRKVLGEVIAPGAEAMNDILGRQTAHEDVASRLQSRGLGGDLRHSIGINDRFMLIRNLFDGDSEAYAAMIARLDGFADLDEALLFLQENYRWDPDNEGLQLLVDLLERKLG